MKKHQNQFKKEYLDLFRAIKEGKENPIIKKLLDNFPYLIVNNEGDLIGKKTAPEGLLNLFRKTRVINPNASKESINQWREKLTSTKQRKRKYFFYNNFLNH